MQIARCLSKRSVSCEPTETILPRQLFSLRLAKAALRCICLGTSLPPAVLAAGDASGLVVNEANRGAFPTANFAAITITDGQFFWLAGAFGLVLATALSWIVVLKRRVSAQRVICEQLTKESEAKQQFQDLFENASDVVYRHDCRGRFTAMNPAGLRLLGCARDEVLRLSLANCVAADELDKLKRMAADWGNNQIAPDYEFTWRSGSGRAVVLESHARLVVGRGGEQEIECVARDVTEQRKAQESRRQMEAKLRSAVDNADAFIARCDTQRRWLFVNRPIERASSLAAAAWIGKTCEEMGVPAEITARFNDAVNRTMEARQTIDLDFDVSTPVGVRHFQGHLVPELSASGELESVLVIARDATTVVEAKKQLEESERRFRTLVESADLILWEFDPARARRKYISPQAARLGYPLADWQQPDFWASHIHQDDRDKAVEFSETEIRAQRPHRHQYRFATASGDYVWIDDRVTIESRPDATAVVRGMMLDITERKRAEADLRASEAQLIEAQQVANIGSWNLELPSFKLKWSRQEFIINGLPPASEITYEQGESCIHPEDRGRLKDEFLAAIASGQQRFNYEHRIVWPNGEVRDIEGKAEIFRDPQGNPVRVVGTSHDVTERNREEARLRELTLAQANAMPGISRLDPAGRYVFVNDAYAALTGYSAEDLVNHSWELTIHPEDRDLVLAAFAQMKSEGKAEFEARGFRKDGSLFWKHVLLVRVGEPHGAASGHYCFMREITRRKLAEEALRESEANFRAFVELCPAGIVIVGDRQILYINQYGARLAGARNAEELIGRAALDFVHPDFRSRAHARLRLLLNPRSSNRRSEEKYVRLDGSAVDVEVVASRVSYRSQPAVQIIFNDLTERKFEHALLIGQKRVLETIAAGANLKATLDMLARIMDELCPEAITSILLLDPEGKHLRHGAAPRLAADYVRAIDGIAIGPMVGSCGTAAYTRQAVTVTDIATDPLWADYKALALAHGLKACVSTPIFGSEGGVLGTFAIYFRTPRAPEAVHLRLIEQASHLAAIAIERDQAEQALRESESMLRSIIDSAMDGIISIDTDQRILVFNRAAELIFGCPAGEAMGQSIERFIPERVRAGHGGHVRRFADEGIASRLLRPGREVFGLRTSGEEFPIEASIAHSQVSGKSIFTIVLRDISHRLDAERLQQQLERQLRQAQKLEAIGRLAGGIAHDFNNILGSVIGYTELARLECRDNAAVKESLGQIAQASRRAKELIRQILAFSRAQETVLKPTDLVQVVQEAAQLLRAAIPKDIEIQIEAAQPNLLVLADASQIHQVLVNLMTNSSQAMRAGGILRVRLARCLVDGQFAAQNPDLKPGAYVRLTVTDTGHGIESAALERIFEPFFTTKPPGEGTGLGLSVVHGIVKSHHGAIHVESTAGAGTTFHIYFPALEPASHPVAETQTGIPFGSGERILIVEDEVQLGDFGRRALERLGYRVRLCHNSAEALEAFRSRPMDFDLLITDLTMPGMNGLDLAQATLRIRPDLPVILTTGFEGKMKTERIHELGIRELLLKPSSLESLAQAVRRALHHTPSRSPDS